LIAIAQQQSCATSLTLENGVRWILRMGTAGIYAVAHVDLSVPMFFSSSQYRSQGTYSLFLLLLEILISQLLWAVRPIAN
jgi:hypothetical protein